MASKSLKNFLGISLVLFAAVTVLTLTGYYLYESGNRSNEVKGYAAILLDVTDPLTVQEQQSILNKFGDFVANTGANTQMEIFVVDTTSTNLLQPLVKGKSLVDVKRLPRGLAVANPQMQKTIWNNTFFKPLEAHLKVAMVGPNSTNSPIMESIQSVALTLFDPDPDRSKPRKLAIVSDLMQNTPGLSFYQSIPTLQQLRQSQVFRSHQIDLQGVQVELWPLRNKVAASLLDPLCKLWTDIITEQRGSVVGTNPVP
jgi:hypothetical protein